MKRLTLHTALTTFLVGLVILGALLVWPYGHAFMAAPANKSGQTDMQPTDTLGPADKPLQTYMQPTDTPAPLLPSKKSSSS